MTGRSTRSTSRTGRPCSSAAKISAGRLRPGRSSSPARPAAGLSPAAETPAAPKTSAQATAMTAKSRVLPDGSRTKPLNGKLLGPLLPEEKQQTCQDGPRLEGRPSGGDRASGPCPPIPRLEGQEGVLLGRKGPSGPRLL